MFPIKKTVPVQDTACSADQLRFHPGPGYNMYFQGQHPNIHLQQFTYLQYLTTYISIYIYMIIYVPPRTKSWYIYIYNSKDKVLDYICFLLRKNKNVPVQDTAYSADQLLFRPGPGYSLYFQEQHPSIHLQQLTYLQHLTTYIVYVYIYIYLHTYTLHYITLHYITFQ